MSFRILSLSGGGIRGIFQAFYLQEIAKNLDKPLAEIFQLIAGTSTGALIALGLGLKIEPTKFVELFKTNGERIFGKARIAGFIRKGARYSAEPLREVLEKIYGEQKLGDCAVNVLVCSTVLDRYRHRIFTNIKRSGEKVGDAELPVVDVSLESCAAPTYFPSFHFKDGSEARTYVDGGLWANNPALAAIIAAHRHLSIPLGEMRLVSLGNGKFPSGVQAEKYNSARPIGMVEDILELMFSCQNAAADDLAGSLIDESNVLSIDTNLDKPIKLDDVKTATSVLPPLAEGEARNHVGKLKAFLFKKSGQALTQKDIEIGLRVLIISVRQLSLLREQEGALHWATDMNAFCGRHAVVTAINSKGIFSVKLDVDSGKHDWALEWLIPDSSV